MARYGRLISIKINAFTGKDPVSSNPSHLVTIFEVLEHMMGPQRS